MLFSEFPDWFSLAIFIGLGLSFGSFLNVVIYRLPREQNLSRPGSRCPGCGTPIRWYDNIPVLGWLLLAGKSRCCKTKISVRYPLVELLGGALAWGIAETRIFPNATELGAAEGFGLFAAYLAVGLGLIAAAAIDLEHMYLPDSITLSGAVLGILTVPLRPPLGFVDALVGAVLGFLVIYLPFIWGYQKLRGFPGMGLGDAKLLLLAGAWFGWKGALFALLAGAVQGTVAVLVVLVARGKIDEPDAVREERAAMVAAIEAAEGEEKAALVQELARDPIGHEAGDDIGEARLAFGPFLVLACLELLLFEEPIMQGLRELLWVV